MLKLTYIYPTGIYTVHSYMYGGILGMYVTDDYGNSIDIYSKISLTSYFLSQSH